MKVVILTLCYLKVINITLYSPLKDVVEFFKQKVIIGYKSIIKFYVCNVSVFYKLKTYTRFILFEDLFYYK